MADEDDDEKGWTARNFFSEIPDPVQMLICADSLARFSLLKKTKQNRCYANMIALGKTWIDRLRFLVIHSFIKSLLLSAKRLQKNTILLKDIIQFSEFWRRKICLKIDEEKRHIINTINVVKDLVANEEKIYFELPWQSWDKAQKTKMLKWC